MSDSQTRVSDILQQLGITDSHVTRCGLPLQQECADLVDAEPDVFGRQPRLAPAAFAAWTSMKAAALGDGVELQIVSAFRSIDYQRDLFLRKLARGDSLEAILQVNAAPGFSEHHSGCALDVGTPGWPHLDESFEQSPAFAWLEVNAGRFGFRMSFPRNNAAGVVYEPWHWCYKQKDGAKTDGKANRKKEQEG